ncbi:MAG: hypothetical protein QOJ74_1280 [Ilumatobacteraceae bacterium]|nr:hypothetical protein [Ilumatobacteraceae bacterium]
MFVCGVAGLIISSVAGNNNGLVLTIGGVIVIAAVVLMTVNTVTVHERIDAFDDAAAEQLEAHITRLVEDVDPVRHRDGVDSHQHKCCEHDDAADRQYEAVVVAGDR